MSNLFENLQILRESNEYFWKYIGKVYVNNMKNKRCIGEIKEPIYTYTSNDNIGAAYHSFINQIVIGNRLYDYSQQIQIDKDNIEKIDSLPDNTDGNLMATIEKITESYGMERYSYVGPVFRFGRLYDTIKQPIYTVAKSYEIAMRNICFKLKEKYGLIKGANLTIDKNKIEKDNEIEELTKNIEKQPNAETKIDDPKYNFDDPDRENNIVESIMSFDDWLDNNFTNLVKDYADLYDIDEEDVYNENEGFEEYINDEYENYYKNTNRYIDEDEILIEDFETSKTYKYNITFDFNIDDALEYDEDDQNVNIININDDCFNETFDTKDKINKFQDWFNEAEPEESKISINNIIYDGFDGEGNLEVTLNSELQDEEEFAKSIVSYLFDNDWPKVTYRVSGTGWEDYWDYATTSPGQRDISVDHDDSAYVTSYLNIKIQKVQ